MDLKEEDILGGDIGRHWYYQSKAAALRRMVDGLKPRRLLDVPPEGGKETHRRGSGAVRRLAPLCPAGHLPHKGGD